MQKADIVLSILNQKSQRDKNYVFNRIYRQLFNQDLYLKAYAKIYAKEGNMTQGVDEETIDGFKLEKIENLIEQLKLEQYYPKPVRRTYIPKKNGKKRPLGIPSFMDKLLGEAIRQILEAIYEPIFSDNSHGFRPNRSCHTALMQIKRTAKGTNWVVEGDITGCFDNINHDILINILSKKINDGRFLELIRRFLKAGYFEMKVLHDSLSGCPQGSIMSPILANIYLNELDKFMEDFMNKSNKGKERKRSKEYAAVKRAKERAIRAEDWELEKTLFHQMRQLSVYDQMDDSFIRVKYVRYADDFVVCVIGSKKFAEEIKNKIAEFLRNKLCLELNNSKTLITNLKNDKARFLNYEFTKAHCNTKLTTNSRGVTMRSTNGKIQLLVPSDVINDKIKEFSKNGKPACYDGRVNMPVLDIINRYNAEMRGLYNYYCLASNVGTRLNKYQWYHYYSMANTIAKKEKCSLKKVIAKYGVDIPRKVGKGTRKIIGVKYTTKQGEKTMAYFHESLSKKDNPIVNLIDKYGNQRPAFSQLIDRLNANTCELCGSKENIEVHHIRKLKDIKDKYKKRGKQVPNWVLEMCRINRKTLIVCHDCHKNIHAGKK